MDTVVINNIKIGCGQPCFVVAEIGAMYEDIEGMKKLIKASSDAGVNAVKIQTYRTETIALPGARFEFENGSSMSQRDFFKQYELPRGVHRVLFDYARKLNITFFSTPSHYDDVDFLDEIGVSVFKIGSDDLTNYPFLEYVAKKGKPMIISTGMSTLSEIEEAVNTVLRSGNEQLILLHCTVSYPASPEYANLNIMKTLREAFGFPVGYSDHVFGVFSSFLAASMGACMIEKHVTLDRKLKRPDYQVSLEPQELAELVSQIRLIPLMKGSSVKKVYPCEEKWYRNARKSLVAARTLKKGEIINSSDIKIIRPGSGVHPRYLGMFIGKRLKKDIGENEFITKDDI